MVMTPIQHLGTYTYQKNPLGFVHLGDTKFWSGPWTKLYAAGSPHFDAASLSCTGEGHDEGIL